MTPRSPTRLVTAYVVYQAASSSVFFSPIFVVFYQQQVGLPLSTILWLQSYYLVLRAVLDLPLGVLADRWSRRGCLVAHALGHAVGAALLIAAPSLAGVVIAETTFAVAAACKSGADSALLYDTLKAVERLDLYARAESRAQAAVALASGTMAIAGGIVASIDLRLPYAATVGSALVAAVIATRLGSAPPARPDTTSPALLREAGRVATTAPAVRWVMGLAALTVVASHVYYYLQQPYLAAQGVPVALFGVVFAATKGVTALVAAGAHRIDRALGVRAVAAIMTVVPALGLAAMSVVSGPWAAVLVLSRGLLDGLWQPLSNVYLNRLVESRLRATLLSAQSMLGRLALGGTVALLGLGTAGLGLHATLAAAAGTTALLGGLLVVRRPRALAAGGPCASRRA